MLSAIVAEQATAARVWRLLDACQLLRTRIPHGSARFVCSPFVAFASFLFRALIFLCVSSTLVAEISRRTTTARDIRFELETVESRAETYPLSFVNLDVYSNRTSVCLINDRRVARAIVRLIAKVNFEQTATRFPQR